MYRLTSKLIVYREIGEDSILMQLAQVCRDFERGEYDKEALTGRILDQIHRLLDLATRYGFNKNLWHNYLAFLLAMTETPFTLVSEKTGANEGSVNHFVKNDLRVFKKLFDYDFSPLEEALETDVFSVIEDYHAVGKKERVYNHSVSEKVQELSENLEKAADENDMYRVVTDFYRDYGAGMFGLNKAFRIVPSADGDIAFHAINNMEHVMLDDLIGYEIQKKKLVDNTEAFVSGRKANNVLLFGDAGTGKSTSIKAIVNAYYDRGLRMIEIYKHQFHDLSGVIARIKNRNYRFIIYMDDLSFEEDEVEYKFLKAVIEGGVETKPENILIYATSNRRHLIRETWNDRNDMEYEQDLHRSDTMEEKLSLVSRFGVQISYMKPSKKEFNHIVIELARRNGITMSDEKLCLEANRWELAHRGISGRTAQQFINYLLGMAEE